VKGSADKLVPLSTFATLKTTTEPRSLNKFQQLNAVRIQGVIPPPVPLDKALTFLEEPGQTDSAAGIYGRLRWRVPAAPSREASSWARFCSRQS
jgi:multidrug efflux pump subunit AcrB